MRLVSNEEFEKALKNIEYEKIMTSASRGLVKNMTREEIRTCRLDALWKSLAKYEAGKSKFETFLYNYTRWIILKHKNSPKQKEVNFTTLSNSGYDIAEHEPAEEIPVNFDTQDLLVKLNPDERTLVDEFYFKNVSMANMAKTRECSRQCIHQKIKRVIKKLQEIHT